METFEYIQQIIPKTNETPKNKHMDPSSDHASLRVVDMKLLRHYHDPANPLRFVCSPFCQDVIKEVMKTTKTSTAIKNAILSGEVRSEAYARAASHLATKLDLSGCTPEERQTIENAIDDLNMCLHKQTVMRKIVEKIQARMDKGEYIPSREKRAFIEAMNEVTARLSEEGARSFNCTCWEEKLDRSRHICILFAIVFFYYFGCFCK